MAPVDACVGCFSPGLPQQYPPDRVAVGTALVAILGVIITVSVALLLRYRNYTPIRQRNLVLLILQVVGTSSTIVCLLRELVGEGSMACLQTPISLALIWAAMFWPMCLRLLRATLLAHTNMLLHKRRRSLSLEKSHAASIWMLQTSGLMIMLATGWVMSAIYVVLQLLLAPLYSTAHYGCLDPTAGDTAFVVIMAVIMVLVGTAGTLYIFFHVKDPVYFRTEHCMLFPSVAIAFAVKIVLLTAVKPDVVANGQLQLLSSRWVEPALGIFVCVVTGLVPGLKAWREVSGVKPMTDAQLALDFQRVLSHESGEQAFLQHLNKELSSENWAFYHEADLSSDTLTNEDITERVKHVFVRYIQAGAALQVNLPNVLREEMTEIVSAGPPYKRDIFWEPREEIYSLMERDSFRRFTRSAAYRTLKKRDSFKVLSEAPDLVSTRAPSGFTTTIRNLAPMGMLGESAKPQPQYSSPQAYLQRTGNEDGLGQVGRISSVANIGMQSGTLSNLPSFDASPSHKSVKDPTDMARLMSLDGSGDTLGPHGAFSTHHLRGARTSNVSAVSLATTHSFDSGEHVTAITGSVMSMGLTPTSIGGRSPVASPLAVRPKPRSSGSSLGMRSPKASPSARARSRGSATNLAPITEPAVEADEDDNEATSTGSGSGSAAALVAEELLRRGSASSTGVKLPPLTGRKSTHGSLPGRDSLYTPPVGISPVGSPVQLEGVSGDASVQVTCSALQPLPRPISGVTAEVELLAAQSLQ